MKPKALILLVTIALTLLLSPAVSMAAAEGQGSTDMTGHNMDMSGQGMDMSGSGQSSGMDHGGQASSAGNSGNHNSGTNGVQNTGVSRGGSEVNSQAVLGGFGLINGLIILSAAMLRRKSFMAGGN